MRRILALAFLLSCLVTISPLRASAQTVYRASGTITTNGSDCSVAARCVTLSSVGVANTSAVAFDVRGSWTGTLTFEASIDGTNFFSMRIINQASGAEVTTTTASGQWVGTMSAYKSVRVRGSASMTGTGAVVTIAAGVNVSPLPSAASVSMGTVSEDPTSQLATDTTAIKAATESASTSLSTLLDSLATDAVQGNDVIASGPQSFIEAKDFDGSALPNNVAAEGKSVRSAGSLYGVQYMMLVSEDGALQYGTTTTPLVTRQSDGTNLIVVDPCASVAKTTDPFSLTARGVIIAAVSAKKNYICSITVVAGAAEIFNVVEGTGTTCQTGTAAIVGSTTAASGLSFAANGGFSAIGGNSTVLAGKTANVDTCIVPSGSNRLAGFVTYVQR